MRLSCIGIAVTVLACATSAQAQRATSIAVDPLDLLPKPASPAQPTPAPQLDLKTPAGPGRLDQRLTPARFDIEGVNALPFADLAGLFAPLAGQPVTVGQLAAVARVASAKYRDAGYPLSFVYLPEQDFAGGVVRVVAVEGYIASVRIEGDAGAAEPKLREMAQLLQADKPLRLATFERATQLMARLPGLAVTADAAMPGTTDGATVLALKVQRQPYNISLGGDMRQPTSRLVLTGRVGDLLASGSDLTASTLLGNYSREKFGSVGYTQFVGADGLALKTTYSDYRGYPDEAMGKGSLIERYNTNKRLEFSGSYPLMLTARSSLFLSGGLYGVDNVDEYSVPSTGAQLTDQTRIRAAFLQLAYVDATPERSRNASAMLAQGIDGMGALAELRSNVPGLSGPGPAKLNFTRLSFDMSQRDRFANLWGTAVSVGGQISGDTLASSERVSFGGSRYGRGYAAGDGSGDSGLGVGLELNRAFPYDSQWLRQIEPYVLLEAAHVSTHVGRPVPRDLGSAALGLRLTDNRHYSLDVAVAKPTGDAALNNPQRDVRVSLLLSYQLEALGR
ncbi:ShlB/FhaC/HecB family hemolysin secretion/activation protein [Variovorax sp. LARHSF232]